MKFYTYRVLVNKECFATVGSLSTTWPTFVEEMKNVAIEMFLREWDTAPITPDQRLVLDETRTQLTFFGQHGIWNFK